MTSSPRPPAGGVPAQPVVQIEIFGSTVSVNGVVIVHDGTQSLHHVAVHAAAERVARPLGRAVRAQAIDSEGRATLVVHPDGHASDVELVETYDSEAEAVAAVPAATAPLFAQFADDATPAGSAPGGAPAGPPPTAYTRAAYASSTAAAPERGHGWPSKVVRMVAVAAALVAVIGLGVLLIGNRSGDGAEQARDRDTSSETDTSTETDNDATPSPVAASASLPATSTPVDPDAPTLSVVPLGGINALRLTITTDTVPSTADVVVTATGKTVTRSVSLDDETTEVDLGRIPAGTVTWQVSVAGAQPQTGTVNVTGPYVAPTPTPTAVAPVAPVPPAPVTTVTVPAEPTKGEKKKNKNDNKPSAPATKKPSKPSKPSSSFGKKKKKKPSSQFGDKGTGGNKPNAPVDPDDQ